MAAVKIWVLVNPRAGSGRSVAKSRAFLELVPHAELIETSGTRGAIEISRTARREGVDVLVPVGGDGTLQQCATGLCLEEDGTATPSSTRLLMVPAGTGGDYRKTFSITESVQHAATRLAQPTHRQVDIGRVEYQCGAERKVTAFINVLSFGLGGLTDRIVETSPKWIGGKATYLLSALRATMVHQPTAIELVIDGKHVETAPFSNVAVCLGQYFGGGMKIAPDADPSDGKFDIVTMELDKLRTIALAGHIYRGTHLQQAGVRHYRGTKVEAKAQRAEQCLIDADGEPTGALPLSIEVLPKALTLIT